MRLVLSACLVAAALSVTPAAAAETAPSKAVGCDNLVTLRTLIIDGEEGPTTVAEHTGCREVEPDKVGAVERRTIIGGMPYECRSVPGGPCLWIRP